jgi:hypothetical protein
MSDEFRAALGRMEERLADRQDRAEERLIEQQDRSYTRIQHAIGQLEVQFVLKTNASQKEIQATIDEIKEGAADQQAAIQDLVRRVVEMEKHRPADLASAAEGAARGAGTAASVTAADTAKVTAATIAKGFWATWTGKTVAVAAAFSAIVTAFGLVPGVVKYTGKFLDFIAGLAK